MYSIGFIVFLVSYSAAGSSDDVFVDLLKSDFTGYKDIARTNDSVLFGPRVGNLEIDKKSMKSIVKYFTNFNDRALFIEGKLNNGDFGRSTLVMLKNPLSNRVYLEVAIQKEKLLHSIVEGWIARPKKTVEYSLVLTYTSNGRQVEKIISMRDKFKEGKWFTLAVRILDESNIEVTFDCEVLENAKLLQSMDPIHKYLSGRLAQSVQRDIFTLKLVAYRRFIGEMKQAMFVFGRESFYSLNPCKHHNAPGFILEGPTEKKPSQEALKHDSGVSNRMLGTFDIFQDASCMYNWKFHANGEEWQEGSCQKCKCKNAQTFCTWITNCQDLQLP